MFFKEGSRNYNVVCNYNKSVLYWVKVMHDLDNGVLGDWAEHTKRMMCIKKNKSSSFIATKKNPKYKMDYLLVA